MKTNEPEAIEDEMDTNDLSERQKEIFDFIGEYLDENGYPPTVREIGKAVGLQSSSTVHSHLSKLESQGLLRKDPTKPRAIELMVGRDGTPELPAGLPLVGQVAAGSPITAEENIEDYLQVPQVIGGETGDFILRVKGDSMKKVGIMDSDYVVVRPSEVARDGEIVVAMVGDDSEATVKRFFREADRVRLEPENDDLEAIYSDQVALVGTVVGVFRRVS